jgi:RNA polymerase sigma-70 factor, ECF subfamily
MDHDIIQLLDQHRYDEALEILIDRYKDKVFRLAYAMLGNEYSAHDAAQDTFIRVWRALRKYRRDAALSTWIYAIARNTCRTASQSARTRQTFSIEEPGIRLLVESRTASSPAPYHGRDIPDVMSLLTTLPPQYRTVLMLFYLEQRSVEEVAIMLALPPGTVKTYLHRARKAVAAAYASRTPKGVM